MLKVGLTGSIAVGKSFVASVLAESGAHVLDADQTARDVVAPETEGWRAVVAAFGREILWPDGNLNRARLGEIIFADAARRQTLNSIVHPLVFAAQDEALQRWARADPDGVGIIDAALLIESGGYRRFDKLVVVHCQPEIQSARLQQRNGLTPAQAEQRIAAQMPQAEKMSYADYLIDSSDGFAGTRRRAQEIYRELSKLAARESLNAVAET